MIQTKEFFMMISSKIYMNEFLKQRMMLMMMTMNGPSDACLHHSLQSVVILLSSWFVEFASEENDGNNASTQNDTSDERRSVKTAGTGSGLWSSRWGGGFSGCRLRGHSTYKNNKTIHQRLKFKVQSINLLKKKVSLQTFSENPLLISRRPTH